MKKIIAMLLCVGMVFSFTACQDKNDTSSEVDQESSIQAEEQAKDQQDEQIQVNEYNMPMAADSMLDVAQALVVTDVQTDLEYAVWNTDYIWTACGMMIASGQLNGVSGEIVEDYVYVSSDIVKQCINAMFAGFDGNIDELPEIPDNIDVKYDEASDRYGFGVGDYGDQKLEVLEWYEAGSNGINMKVALFSLSEDKQISGTYEIFMNGTTFEGDNPLFNYMVASFVMIEPAPSDVTGGDGHISKAEALALVEDKYDVEDGAADPDTGNIIGYGYEGIETVDGVNYHNFRMTWLVMNEDGEADHSSYLMNVFVSVDGTKIMEGYREGDGWEFMED